MKLIEVGLVLVVVAVVAVKCNPVLVEESTARVEEIFFDTKSQQSQREQLLQPISRGADNADAEENEQVVKGQPRYNSEDADKLPSLTENENPLVGVVGRGDKDSRKRAQRMYTETYTYFTAEDIGDMLRKVRLPGTGIRNTMRSRSAINKPKGDVVVVKDTTSDKPHAKDKVYIVALVEKDAPHVGLGLTDKQMLSIITDAAANAANNESEERYKKKALNKYLRRMYRKLRRNVKRNVKKHRRKASFRSNDPMTVEKVIAKKRNKKKEDQDIYKLLLG